MRRIVETLIGCVLVLAGCAAGWLMLKATALTALGLGLVVFLVGLGAFFVSKSLVREFVATAGGALSRVLRLLGKRGAAP